MFILDFLVLSLCLIFSVAFITLFERKLLGYIQHRKGPNKPSVKGVLTPGADALKLMFKESVTPWSSSSLAFIGAPLLSLFLFVMILAVIPFKELASWGGLSLLLLVVILSWNVYPLFFSGWGSNSAYSFLGSVRGIAQSISYEISLAFLAISLISVMSSLNLATMSCSQYGSLSAIALVPALVLWMYSGVAETNRAPFDFAESESELVSGFNIEYGSMKFALIFLAEYGMILFLSILTSVFSGVVSSVGLMNLSLLLVPITVWVWIRGTFPRYRYDLLMQISWKSILPLSLGLCFYSLGLNFNWAF